MVNWCGINFWTVSTRNLWTYINKLTCTSVQLGLIVFILLHLPAVAKEVSNCWVSSSRSGPVMWKDVFRVNTLSQEVKAWQVTSYLPTNTELMLWYALKVLKLSAYLKYLITILFLNPSRWVIAHLFVALVLDWIRISILTAKQGNCQTNVTRPKVDRN